MSTYLYSAFDFMFLSYQERVLAGTFALREKCLKYGVFSIPYFFVLTPNTGKMKPEIKWVWVRFPLRSLKLQINSAKYTNLAYFL